MNELERIMKKTEIQKQKQTKRKTRQCCNFKCTLFHVETSIFVIFCLQHTKKTDTSIFIQIFM